MRVALLASQAALPGRLPPFGRRISSLARMLRLLGHECLLLGVAGDPPLGDVPPHVDGTPRHLLQEVPAGEGRQVLAAEAFLAEEVPDVLWLLQLRGAADLVRAAEGRAVAVVGDVHALTCGVDALAGDVPGAGDERRFVLARCDLVVAHTEGECATAEGEGVDREVLRLVPFGLPELREGDGAGSPGRNGGNGEVAIAYAGPLVPAGGAHTLLEALGRAPDLDVAVTIEACGEVDPDYERQVLDAAGRDRRATVVAAGAGGAGAGVDVLVVPSAGGACPVPVLDAVAAGATVVASDRSGVAEAVGAAGAVEVFPAGDAVALAALLRSAAAGPRPPAGARRRVASVTGIEQEAVGMERVATEAVDRADRARLEPAGRSVTGGTEPEPTRLVGGGLDFPRHRSTVPRTAVQVTGWALTAPSPVSRIEVAMNGAPPGKARTSLPRPVLLDAFSDAEAAVCGFEHWIDLSTLPPDVTQARFEAAVVALDGTSFPLAPIEVTVEAPPRPSAQDRERAEVLDERMRAVAGGPEGRAPLPKGHVQVVAFSHRLGYGGAELYLFELLRQLAAEPWFGCTVVSPNDGPLRAEYEALGVAVHITDYPHVGDLELYEGRQVEMAAWLRSHGCNVVLGNTLMAFPWMDVARRAGIAGVWAIHESYALSTFFGIHVDGGAMHPLVRDRIPAALRSAAALVFVADATRRLFEPYADQERLVTVDYGIDIAAVKRFRGSADRSHLRAALGIPDDAEVLLCLGAVEPRKSQALLARAFRRLAPARPSAFLAVVGDRGGDYADALRRYLDAAGLAARSRVVPMTADTYPWYAVADLFVHPSDVESLPRTILEAMAFEVPVVAADAYGVAELIDDGRTGYLCPPRDLGRLTEVLERVLAAGPAARGNVGSAGARVVEERHDSSGYAAAYAQLLQALAGDGAVLPAAVVAGASRVPVPGAGGDAPV